MNETLAAGDVVITGSGVPAVPLSEAERYEVVHHGLGWLVLIVA